MFWFRVSTLILVVGSCTSTIHIAHAQQPQEAQPRSSSWTSRHQQEAIDGIVVAAREAMTLDDFTRVLAETKGIYRRKLTPQNKKYLLKLIAWLNVSRGEKQAERAAELASQGQTEKADQFENQAIKDFTRSITASPSWRAHHNRGVSHAMMGEFEKALEDFNIAVQRNPKDFGSTYYNRAEILFELGQYQDAESDYTRAYQLDAKDVSALVGRAHARYYSGKVDDAIRDFDRVVQVDPENAVAYADRGDAYAGAGEWEKAARDFKMAIKLDRNLGRAFQSAAWLMATCPDQNIRNPELSVKVASRAIQIDGDQDYRYLDTLAAAQASAKQFAAAKQTQQQAVQVALSQAPEEVVTELKARMASYQAGRPYLDLR